MDRALVAFRQQIGQSRSAQRIGNQTVSQMLGIALHTGFQFLGLLDHRNDLVITAAAAHRFHLDRQLALFHNGSCINGTALSSPYSHGFTGQGSLVDHSLAGYGSVEGDHGSHMNHKLIVGFTSLAEI